MYSCPFCHSEFDAWNPFGHTAPILREVQIVGGGGRANALCPRCGSLDRERLLYLFIQEKTALLLPRLKAGPWRVLHVAPALRLRHVLCSAPGLEYVAVGLEEGNWIYLDVTDIEYPNQSFDVIICNHVLEHVQDDGKAMRELCRVLAWDGWAILQVPYSATIAETIEDPTLTTPEERYRAFGQKDHVRIYSLANYVWRLEQAGFEVELYDLQAQLGADAVKYGLNLDELIILCHRRAEC
jgi:SAM-dependent methyltransferase